MAHESAAASIAAAQQQYALKYELPSLMQRLLTSVVCDKPERPLPAIARCAQQLACTKQASDSPVSGLLHT